MKKTLFSLLFLLLFACVTVATILGVGSSYLFQRGILWMDEGTIPTIMDKADQSVLLLRGLELELGMELEKYFLKPDDGASIADDVVTHELAKKLLTIGMEKSWVDAKEFAEKYHVEYYVYHVLGRPYGGNLAIANRDEATCETIIYAGDSANEFKVYVCLDKQAYQEKPLGDYRVLAFWIQNRYLVVTGFAVFAAFSLILLGAECLMIKHKNLTGKMIFGKAPLDLFVCLGIFGTLFFYSNIYDLNQKNWTNVKSLILNWCGMTLLIQVIFLYVFWRVQLRGWYRENVLYGMLLLIKREGLAWVEVFKNLPVTWKFLLLEVGLYVIEGATILLLTYLGKSPWILLAALGVLKLVLIPWIVRYGIALERVRRTTREFASGNLESHMEVSKLPRSLREIGENVNSLAGSISVAVEEKLKSERLKTELITNVSHDIKTPLTSIINFSDMIQKEKTENEKITEFAEHLHKQSTRLKKLLEDLMEASKASTGNLEAHMEPCNVKVLLGQCLGEFEPRLLEKRLELVVNHGEEQLRIMADNRMLWRVFENLMNNICKYAQPDTRVYLSAKEVDGQALITFKNVSKYPLDIAPEELMERFVRGDLSRHTEGSGLGLAIVSSLMELQGGMLKLSTDGDLFKAILEFPLLVDAN